jgi:hypothetical protein
VGSGNGFVDDGRYGVAVAEMVLYVVHVQSEAVDAMAEMSSIKK